MIIDGDFCLFPNDIEGRACCVVCRRWFRITIYGIRPEKKCIVHGVIHSVYCCDCYNSE